MTTTGRAALPGPARTVLVVGPVPELVDAVLTVLTGPPAVRATGLELHRAPDGTQLLRAVGAPPRPATAQAGLRAAGGLVLVVPAAGGPDPVSAQLWEQCRATGVPRALVITGFDVPGADHDEALALGRRLLGDELHALTVPMHSDDEQVAGVLDVLRLEVADSSTGRRVLRHPDPEHTALVGGLRDDLVEALLAGSHDEGLLDRYLEGAPLSLPTLTAELGAAVREGRVAPALAVHGTAGADELSAVLAVFPRADQTPVPAAVDLDGAPAAVLEADPEAAAVVEVLAPAGAGWLVAVRSGTVRAGARLRVGRRDVVVGSGTAPLAAGAVGLLEGLAGAAVGETLSSQGLHLSAWPLPEPLHAVALPVDRDAEDLARRDPTLRVERRDGRWLLWALDADHAREVLGAPPAAAALGDEPVRLRVEVPAAFARPTRRALVRHATTEVGRSEHEERELVLLTGEVAERALPALAADLRAASGGTAWAYRL